MERLRSSVLIVSLIAIFAAPSARAQDKPVSVNLGAGYTFALSDVREHLGDGYNFNLGLTFNVNQKFGIQAEYGFTGLGEKRVNLPTINPPPGETLVRDVFADMNMHYGSFNAVFRPASEGRARPFILAGFGVYYRPVKVTTPGAGYVPPVLRSLVLLVLPRRGGPCGLHPGREELNRRRHRPWWWCGHHVERHGELLCRSALSLHLWARAQGRCRRLARHSERAVPAAHVRLPVLTRTHKTKGGRDCLFRPRVPVPVYCPRPAALARGPFAVSTRIHSSCRSCCICSKRPSAP